MVMQITTDPSGAFRKAVRKAGKDISDLTIPLTQVKKQWYQGNKSIFVLKGPGKYDDITSRYKKAKAKKVGSVYPLLEAQNKRIKKAITTESDQHAFSKVSKDSVELGVKKSQSFPYAFAIHYGSSKQNLPARPYVLLGVEQVATKDQQSKVKVYLQIIEDFAVQVTKGFADE